MARKTYLELSNDDYKSAVFLHEGGHYNQVVRLCQQSIEKRFKHFLELHGGVGSIDLFKSHRLYILGGKFYEILHKKPDPVVFNYLYKLTDHYLVCSYPSADNESFDISDSQHYINFTTTMNREIDEALKSLART